MSKQLAISSSFATFAMAAMALFVTPGDAPLRSGDSPIAASAGSALEFQGAPGLSLPSLLRD